MKDEHRPEHALAAPEALLAFALGTFHTLFAVFPLVVGLYLGNVFPSTFGTGSTLIGMGVFIALYVPTLAFTCRAFKRFNVFRAGPFDPTAFSEAARSGRDNGLAFFLTIIGVNAVASATEFILDGKPANVFGVLLATLLFGLIGGLFAMLIGGFVGFVVATLDAAILDLAGFRPQVVYEPPSPDAA